MFEVINCPKCGRVFESNGYTNICISCIEQDEQDFTMIKEYLRSHPCASIFDVSSSLDLSISKIKRYLREGRLEILEKNNSFLHCETCGKPICSGKYCDDCFRQSNHDYKVIYTGSYNTPKEHKINYSSRSSKKMSTAAIR